MNNEIQDMATAADFERIGNYALVLNKQKNIDRLKCKRTVPMEVLSLGYSRTGTLSMRKALEILGYPNPYHFSSFMDNAKECDLWMRALDAKYYGKGDMPDKAFWDGLLGHVGAVTDAPCQLFGSELLQAYPDAKVILVEREIEKWYVSWMNFCKDAYNPVLHFLGRLDPYVVGRINSVGAKIVHVQAGFSSTFDEAVVRSKDAYRHHYRDMKELVPKAQLLEFQLSDGWEPLCKFLGKPVPSVPFPHENEKERNAAAFATIGQTALRNIIRNVVMAATVMAIPMAAAIWYGKTR